MKIKKGEKNCTPMKLTEQIQPIFQPRSQGLSERWRDEKSWKRGYLFPGLYHAFSYALSIV